MADKPLESLKFPGLNDTYVNTPLSTAPTFNTTTAYAVGDYVFYDRKLYRFTAAHSAGAWNSAQVTEVTVGGELSGVHGDYVKKTDYATYDSAGIIKANANFGLGVRSSPNHDQLMIVKAPPADVKAGENYILPIVPSTQHSATFYGLAKAAGVDMKNSDNAVGTYTTQAKTAIRSMLGAVGDVQANGASVLSNGVANIPYATTERYGVVKINTTYGLNYAVVNGEGVLAIQPASNDNIKASLSPYRPIVAEKQHMSTFYGLAKAAGDNTQSASDNAVGTYTQDAKLAIQSMLGIDVSSAAPYVETVSGATPSITAEANYRYVCGEVTAISITPPASGTCDVQFTSGSTVAILTLPSTVKMPDWFDASSLETNTVYEIMITDGVWGCVNTWTL